MNRTLLLLISFVVFTGVSAQTSRVDPQSKQYSFNGSLGGRQYMFYGYAEPDNHAKKLILFSTYPMDVSSNSMYTYPLGAYHETTSLKDGDHIYYVRKKGRFAEMKYVDGNNKQTTFYMHNTYVHL